MKLTIPRPVNLKFILEHHEGLALTVIRFPDRPARFESQYWLSYSDPYSASNAEFKII
jgi:hypothetical protein